MADAQTTDVAIIGAGPVGLFAVFECGMLKMRCHVFDALDMPGGQCAALYPEKPIYDIPGYPAIDAAGADRASWREQAAALRSRSITWASGSTSLARAAEGGFRLGRRRRHRRSIARAVIVAAGVGAFGPNRPPLAGIEAYEGKSVFYLVQRREDFRGKRVVIAGGGDSAVDWALSLAEVAAQVMRGAPAAEVPRRAGNRRRGSTRSPRRAGSSWWCPISCTGSRAAAGGSRAVVVADLDGKTRALEADVLLPFFGLSMNLGPIADWGLELERNHIAVDPATCADLGARHLRDRRHRDLSGQAEAHPLAASPRRRWRPTRSSRWCIRARRCISSIRRPRACRASDKAAPQASAEPLSAAAGAAGDGGVAAR